MINWGIGDYYNGQLLLLTKAAFQQQTRLKVIQRCNEKGYNPVFGVIFIAVRMVSRCVPIPKEDKYFNWGKKSQLNSILPSLKFP